ncbi:MAG: hypothetical protein R3D88_02860 [Alphaproteobacteria bacterium]
MVENRRLLESRVVTKKMVAKKAIPELEEIRLNHELANIWPELVKLANKKTVLRQNCAVQRKRTGRSKINLKARFLGELNDIEAQISQLNESLTAIGDRVLLEQRYALLLMIVVTRSC